MTDDDISLNKTYMKTNYDDNLDNALEAAATRTNSQKKRASDYENEIRNTEHKSRPQIGFFWVLFVNNIILLSRRYVTVTIIVGAPVVYIFIARTQRMNAYVMNFKNTRESNLMTLSGCLSGNMTTKKNMEFRCGGYRSQVIYFPKSKKIDAIMETINYTVTGISTEREFSLMFKTGNVGMIAAVEFTNIDIANDKIPDVVKYTIKINKHSVDANTIYPVNNAFPPKYKNIASHAEKYRKSHFVSVQRAVDIAIINYRNPRANLNNHPVNIRAFPLPPYIHDRYYDQNINDLSFVAMIFLFYMVNFINDVLIERESKIKESLKMMGINVSTQWLAIICTYLVPMLVTNIVLTVALGLDVMTDPVMQNMLTDPQLVIVEYYMPGSVKGKVLKSCLGGTPSIMLFILLTIYGVTALFFSLFISVFLQGQSNMSTLVLLLLAVIMFLINWVIQLSETETNYFFEFVLCLNFYYTFSAVFKYMHSRDVINDPLSWDDMSSQIHHLAPGMSMSSALSYLTIDAILFFMLSWYMDKIYPGEYGVPENIFFIFSPAYWCGYKLPCDTPINTNDHELPEEDHEPYSPDRAVGVKVMNLTKRYSWRGNNALDNLSLDILYEDITVILGYNGAGKSSLILTLTGFYPPTSGDAIINGYQLTTELSMIQKSLGICTQYDILYPYLTFDEHVRFFGWLRGNIPNWDKIDEMIENFDMTRKKHLISEVLSGGEKRKLSVILALMGDSKIIFLDEPSSGMDPESRRVLWRLLKKERFGRTIIISTHYMDEADYLADRILILSNGRLHCSGSPSFLKKKFGTGYLLNCEISKESMIPTIKNYMNQKMPSSTVERETNSEIIFLLPIEEIAQYRNFFWYFDGAIASLGIKSYSVSSTSLEEVFSKTIARTVSPDENKKAGLFSYAKMIEYVKYEKKTGIMLYIGQILGMALMRFYQLIRNPFIILFRFIMPIILFMVLYTIIQSMTPVKRKLDILDTGDSIIRYGHVKLDQLDNIRNSANKDSPFIINSDRILDQMNGTEVRDISEYPLYLRQLIDSINIRRKSNLEPKECDTIESSIEDPVYNSLLESTSKDILIKAIYGQYIGVTYYALDNDTIFTKIMYSEQTMHMLPVAVNLVDNALLKMYAGDKYSIETSTYPLAEKELLKDMINDFTMDSATLGFLICLLPVVIAVLLSFIPNAVSDRINNMRSSMLLNGLHPNIMWISILAMDTIILMISLLITMITMWKMSDFFPIVDVVMFTFVLLLLTVASLSAIHIIANLMSSTTHAIMISSIYIVLLTSLYYNVEEEYRDFIQKMNPITNLLVTIVKFFDHLLDKRVCGANLIDCTQVDQHYCCYDCKLEKCMLRNLYEFDSRGVVFSLIYAVIHIAICITILLIMELRFADVFMYMINKDETCNPADTEDSDITAEREKVDSLYKLANNMATSGDKEQRTKLESELNDSAIILQKVVKSYKCCALCNLDQFRPIVAVQGVSLNVSKNECFGLLGVNGAGKSTLFKMMTGLSMIDGGDILVNKISLKTCSFTINKSVGYCPQDTILFNYMTPIEHMFLFGRIRGLNEGYLSDMVEALVNLFFLQGFRNTHASKLSGGNQRKLCMAICMISSPPLIFMDEPTSGMDPVSRRSAWDAIESYRKNNGTVILTSHSMDECEELCTRLVIMVNGRFQCIGSQQHLKAKFGHGCTLMVYLSKDTDMALTVDEQKEKFRPVIDLIADNFPGTRLMEVKQLTLKFNIPQEMVDWSNLFGTMEKAKQLLEIEHYTMAQTTIEKIFITFAEDKDLYN